MQVSNDFVILARDFSVDDRDQMLSIFKIIDKFNFKLDPENYARFLQETKNGPVIMPALYVMTSSWSLDKPATKEIALSVVTEIIDPSGKKIGDTTNELVFAKGLDRVRLNGGVEGLPTTTNGFYTVKVSLKDKETGKVWGHGQTRYQISVEKQDPGDTVQQ